MQPLCADGMLGKQGDTGGVLVQTSDGMQPGASAFLFQLMVELDAQRIIIMPVSGVEGLWTAMRSAVS